MGHGHTVRSKFTEGRVQLTSEVGAANGHIFKAEVAKATVDWVGEQQGLDESRHDRSSLPMCMHSRRRRSGQPDEWLDGTRTRRGSLRGGDLEKKDKATVVAKRRIHSGICAQHTHIPSRASMHTFGKTNERRSLANSKIETDRLEGQPRSAGKTAIPVAAHDGQGK